MANRVERQHLAASSVIGGKVNENFRPRITAVTFSQYQVTGDMQDEITQLAQTKVYIYILLFFFSRQYEMCSTESVDVLTACPTPETKLLTVKGAQKTVSRSFVEISHIEFVYLIPID